MELVDLVHRPDDLDPWADEHKLPWSDPDFSRRMLAEHLNQEHDAASRRREKIDRHVDWIHKRVLKKRKTKVLDLGCGPGFYANRLSERGHNVVGIDFAPAAIRYARKTARQNGLASEFIHADVREADFGREFDLVMMVFGEINTFAPNEIDGILRKIRSALNAEGTLLLECHTFDAVENEGRASSSWNTAELGLFSDRPHLWLKESRWNESEHLATTNYYVVDAATARVEKFTSNLRAYTDEEYRSLLRRNQFGRIRFQSGLAGPKQEAEPGLQVILARRSAARPVA